MPNERDLLSCSINSIRIWNFSTGECLKTHYMNESITCLVLLPYTNNIITATAEHRIKIWDLDLEKCLKSFSLTNQNDLIRCLVPMVDSNEFISSSSIYIKIFNLETGVLLRTLKGHTSTVNQVVVVDSLCLISCAADNKIKIWDQIKCHCLKTLVGHLGAVSTLCLVRSKELEFCSGSWDEKIRYWSMRGKCLREFRGHAGRVRCLVRM
jgi:WD40 repeat protein